MNFKLKTHTYTHEHTTPRANRFLFTLWNNNDHNKLTEQVWFIFVWFRLSISSWLFRFSFHFGNRALSNRIVCYLRCSAEISHLMIVRLLFPHLFRSVRLSFVDSVSCNLSGAYTNWHTHTQAHIHTHSERKSEKEVERVREGVRGERGSEEEIQYKHTQIFVIQ